MHVNMQKAVRAMREQLITYPRQESSGTYTTGSSMRVPDLPAYAFAVLSLNIPGSFHSSTSAASIVTIRSARFPEFHTVERAPLMPKDIVAFVRRVFGLNVSDAARAFAVQRPTIYLWSSSDDMSLVRPHNRARMRQLYQLAWEWNKRERLANDALSAVLPETNSTLLDLLSATEIDEGAVIRAYNGLFSMRPTSRREEHRNAAGVLRNLKGAFAAMDANQAARKKRESS